MKCLFTSAGVKVKRNGSLVASQHLCDHWTCKRAEASTLRRFVKVPLLCMAQLLLIIGQEVPGLGVGAVPLLVLKCHCGYAPLWASPSAFCLQPTVGT